MWKSVSAHFTAVNAALPTQMCKSAVFVIAANHRPKHPREACGFTGGKAHMAPSFFEGAVKGRSSRKREND